MKWEAPFGGSVDAVGVVLGPVCEACLRLGVLCGQLRGAKPGVEAEAAAVPSGGRGRGEDRREAVWLSRSGVAASHLGVMGERE